MAWLTCLCQFANLHHVNMLMGWGPGPDGTSVVTLCSFTTRLRHRQPPNPWSWVPHILRENNFSGYDIPPKKVMYCFEISAGGVTARKRERSGGSTGKHILISTPRAPLVCPIYIPFQTCQRLFGSLLHTFGHPDPFSESILALSPHWCDPTCTVVHRHSRKFSFTQPPHLCPTYSSRSRDGNSTGLNPDYILHITRLALDGV